MDQRSSSRSASTQEFSVKNKCGSSKRIARSLVAVELHLLPHDVMRDILSRLSIKDVVRMSILSREWRQLRICHPDLVLTLSTFVAWIPVLVVPASATNLKTATTEFITNVDNLLRPLWSTSTTSTTTLDKFVIKFCLGKNDKYHIDRWVNFATTSRAKHIALDFTEFAYLDSSCDNNMYIFPLCKFSGQNGSCVKSLKLGYVCLKLPPSFCGIANLKKLILSMVSISESDLECMLLSCALLESLSIERCSSSSGVRIRQELCRLQYLRVRHCKLKMIELCAPNLTKFELDNYLTKFVLIQCLKLSEATFVSNLRERSLDENGFRFTFTDLPTALPHVHKLFLLLNVDQVPRFTKAQSRFSNLRNLNMNLLHHYFDRKDTSWVLGLVDLLGLAPLLTEMELHISKNGPRCWLPEPKMVKAAQGPLHRHLRSVHMSGICHVSGLLELALYILGNATVLERMVINPVVHPNRHTDDIHSYSDPVGVDEWDNYYVDETRVIAKQHLDRDEFRHILTFL